MIQLISYDIGVGSIGKIANHSPKVSRAIIYIATTPWSHLRSPKSGRLLVSD